VRNLASLGKKQHSPEAIFFIFFFEKKNNYKHKFKKTHAGLSSKNEIWTIWTNNKIKKFHLRSLGRSIKKLKFLQGLFGVHFPHRIALSESPESELRQLTLEACAFVRDHHFLVFNQTFTGFFATF